MLKLKQICERLYHKDIFLPNDINIYINQTFKLIPSKHSIVAANSEKYGKIQIPEHIKITKDNIIEIEIDDVAGNAKKLTVRLPYNNEFDIVIVFIPNIIMKTGDVKTVWLNKKDDTHYTLKQGVYSNK